jgi:hypothetical protein
MSGDLIVNLQNKLMALRTQKSDIDAEIAEIEGAIRVIEKYAYVGPLGALAALAYSSRPQPKQQQILDGVAAILSDGNPRHTNDLLAELTANGISVGGENPSGNLSAYLSRARDIFVSDRRNGWSLKKQTGSDVGASDPVSDGSDLV